MGGTGLRSRKTVNLTLGCSCLVVTTVGFLRLYDIDSRLSCMLVSAPARRGTLVHDGPGFALCRTARASQRAGEGGSQRSARLAGSEWEKRRLIVDCEEVAKAEAREDDVDELEAKAVAAAGYGQHEHAGWRSGRTQEAQEDLAGMQQLSGRSFDLLDLAAVRTMHQARTARLLPGWRTQEGKVPLGCRR